MITTLSLAHVSRSGPLAKSIATNFGNSISARMRFASRSVMRAGALMALALGQLAHAASTGGGGASADLDLYPISSNAGLFGVQVGARFTTPIFLNNRGPDDVLAATIDGLIPPGLKFIDVQKIPDIECTTPATDESGPIRCTRAPFPFAIGQYISVQLEVGTVPVGTVLRTRFEAGSEASDPDPSNNIAEINAIVVSGNERADLTVTSSASPSAVAPGGALTYSVTLTNFGPDQSIQAGFITSLPITVRLRELISPAGWTCTVLPIPAGITPSALSFLCRTNSLPIGSATTNFLLDVLPSATGSLRLTATTSSMTTDPNSANSSSVLDVPVGLFAPTLIPSLTPTLLLALALLLAVFGTVVARRSVS